MNLIDSWWLFELIIYLLPYSVVWLTGMVLALVFWKKCPQAALLVLLACILELIGAVGGTFLTRWFIRNQFEVAGNSPMWMVTSVLRTALGVTAWALMFFAAFGWRRQALVAPADRRPLPLPPRRPPPQQDIPEDPDPDTIRDHP